MNSENRKIQDVERNLRDVSISRRGGVRTRGGRLPPINMRTINQVMGTKKVVSPNIPQRRSVIKKEPTDSRETSGETLYPKAEPRDDSSRQRKGKFTKAILQTEGTFLAEGPAARIKREQLGLDVGFSLPKISAKERKSELKYDIETIKDMLDTYDSKSFYENILCDKPPHRLPLLKRELFQKIKSELKDEEDDSVEVKIKKEIIEDAEIADSKPSEFKKPLAATKYFRDANNETKLILLKLPSDLPFMKQEKVVDSDDKVKEKSTETESQVKGKDTENEGFIGKMRFMRSGRVKLILGEIELELLNDEPLESCMEAATITVQQDMADLNILGKVDRSMFFSPTVKGLVEKDNSFLSCTAE